MPGHSPSRSKDDLLSASEAAELLNVHSNTVRNWGKSGRLPEVRVGPRRDRRYRRSDILAFRDGAADALPPVVRPGFSTQLRVDAEGELAALGGPLTELFVRQATAAQELQRMIGQAQTLGVTGDLAALAQSQLPFSAVQRVLGTQHLESAGVSAFADLRPLIDRYSGFSTAMESAFRELEPQLASRFLDGIMPAQRAMVSALCDAQQLGPASLTVEWMQRSLVAYQGFSERLFIAPPKLATHAMSDKVSVAALAVAGSILDWSCAAAHSLASIDPAISERHTPQVIPFNVYDGLAAEVEERYDEFEAIDNEELLEVAINETDPAQLATLARRVVVARWECSKRAENRGLGAIFLASRETEQTSFELHGFQVKNETDFRRFVDMLYRYICESSEDLGRLAHASDGAFREAIGELQVRHPIFSHLHTLRHDRSHDPDLRGDNVKAMKQRRHVGTIHKELTGLYTPETPRHWQRAQLGILRRVAALLEELQGRLSG